MSEALLAAILAQQSSLTQLLQFEHTPIANSATVVGFGTSVTASATFTHGSTTYLITMVFTHGNGVQFRFQTNQQALSFIAADFLVDVGVTGQPPFRSSLMTNVNTGGQNAAQYTAFAGRFVGGTTYTITISI